MDLSSVQQGLRVKVERLESTKGMNVRPDFLANRRLGATGFINAYVPGHGGDVWWVHHDDGFVAPYMFTEIEPEDCNPNIVIQ